MTSDAPLPTAGLSRSLRRAVKARPPGWTAPGPRPAGAQGRADLVPGPWEDLCFLSGDWRIFQRTDGHRWSLDDFATAYLAIEEARSHGRVERVLDLGCGIGSVLMMVAWALPHARGLGIEAQALSAALARRSLAYNGAAERCEVRLGDLRDAAVAPEGAVFDLVTGTPPYLPLGQGVVSSRVQRGPCCFELRGGVEAYCAAAARGLAPGGVFVLCAGPRPPDRVDRAAEAAGLAVRRRLEVLPRAGKAALFWLFSLGWRREAGVEQPVGRFRARLADGRLSPEMVHARELVGLPPA